MLIGRPQVRRHPGIAAQHSGMNLSALMADLTTTEEDVKEAIAKWPLEPIGERLYLLKLVINETEGGLIIPQQKTDTIGFDGVVIAAGPLAFIDHPYLQTERCQTRQSLDLFGRMEPSEDIDPVFRWSYRLQPGDRVHYASWSGATEEDHKTGRKAIVCNADDITAVPRRKPLEPMRINDLKSKE